MLNRLIFSNIRDMDIFYFLQVNVELRDKIKSYTLPEIRLFNRDG